MKCLEFPRKIKIQKSSKVSKYDNSTRERMQSWEYKNEKENDRKCIWGGGGLERFDAIFVCFIVAAVYTIYNNNNNNAVRGVMSLILAKYLYNCLIINT